MSILLSKSESTRRSRTTSPSFGNCRHHSGVFRQFHTGDKCYLVPVTRTPLFMLRVEGSLAQLATARNPEVVAFRDSTNPGRFLPAQSCPQTRAASQNRETVTYPRAWHPIILAWFRWCRTMSLLPHLQEYERTQDVLPVAWRR